MQLTRYTDYALRVLIYLAYKDQALSTIGEISQIYGVSENHLMKIVHGLGKLGYVATLRGKGGGLKLGRPPEQIRLGDVVRDCEETLALVECLADGYAGDCRLVSNCKLKTVLSDAQRAFFDLLDQYTLKDLVAKRATFAKVEFHPRPRQPHARARA
ncbi:MAG TPA: Rrf2 family transcriptional regulator [Burkholderiales bacterium]|nr:Rrf2 family transcriptional regulator [Burkholderiales bacterium]